MNANDELRRILEAIQEAQGDSPDLIEDQDLAKTVSMPLQDLRDLLEILEESGYILLDQDSGGYAARIIAKGRLALKSLLPLETILSSPGTGSQGETLEARGSMRTILLLAANPKNTQRIRLDQEQRQIEQALERSKKRDEFKLVSKWAVTDDDLRRALLDYEPEIVHFAGHGSGIGLEFENEYGFSLPINGQALAGLFKLCSGHVQCVVLNACYSRFQAEAIAQHIDFVVGMSKAIGDQAAIKFSLGFYDGIVSGRGYEDAFDLGRNAIDLRGIPEHETPVLLKKCVLNSLPSQRRSDVNRVHLDALYGAAARKAEEVRSRETWTSEDLENIRSQVWRNVNNLGKSWAICPLDSLPLTITLHTWEFTDADISVYCKRHDHVRIEKTNDPMRPSFIGKNWLEHHIKGMSEIVLRGFKVYCPVCGTVVRSRVDGDYVLLNCLRCGQHALVPVR